MGLDTEAFQRMQTLMGDKFTLMVEKYCENAALYIASAHDALARGDAKQLADAVHPLRSSSASLGAAALAAHAGEIEIRAQTIHDNREGDLGDLSGAVGDLDDLFSDAKNELVERSGL